MNVYQRRRVAFATLLTLVALPLLWWAQRDSSKTSNNTGANGAATTVAFTVPVTTLEPPPFLENTVVIAPPAVVEIVKPQPSTTNTAKGKATFHHYDDPTLVRPCSTRFAPSGATITVTNIDNGLVTSCVNNLGYSIPPNADIELDTVLFTSIADLNQAPVPVQITW